MKKKNLVYIIVILFCGLCLTGYLFADDVKKEEIKMVHKTVIIHEYEGLTPQILRVEPGTTVIWVNYAAVEAVIIFLDEEIIDAADCPVYFFIDRDGTYESHEMCAGCTASLCFMEKGSYDYIVKEYRTHYAPGGIERDYRGTILVK